MCETYKLIKLWLNLQDRNISTVLKIINKCPRLNSMFLGRHYMTDKELNQISKCTPRLKQISLPQCIHLTDKGLIDLSKNCPKLKFIDIRFCTRITIKGIITVCNNCPNLNDIKTKGCTGLSN